MATPTDKEKMEPIVNSVLCYVSSARHAMRSDDIIRTCLAFYKENDVIKGKDLLYEILREKSKRRRNENRMVHEVQDMLDVLKKCDEAGREHPLFVTDSYNGLPPSSGFEVVAHSMTTLIEEISSLRKEIEKLKENRLTDDVHRHDSLVIQEDMLAIKGELRKLNHKLMGNEIRRSSFILNSVNGSSNDMERNRISIEVNGCEADDVLPESTFAATDFGPRVDEENILSPSAPPSSQEKWHEWERLLQDDGGPPTAPSFAEITSGAECNTRNSAPFMPGNMQLTSVRPNQITPSVARSRGSPYTHSPNVGSKGHNTQPSKVYNIQSPRVGKNIHTQSVKYKDLNTRTTPPLTSLERRENVPADVGSGEDEERFILVQSRRSRKNVVGSKKTASHEMLKSAIRYADLYVGNCDFGVTSEALEKYISDEMNINIKKCEALVTKNGYSTSFKVTLCLTDRFKLLSSDVWPEGIVCRKFYNPRASNP